MPSIVTHYLMAEKTYNKLGVNKLKKIIKEHYQLFSFASNGPDLFFYYNVYPWMNQKKAKEIASIGSELHSKNINAFFSCLLDKDNLQSHPAQIAYLAGLLCHWALDMKCHPYIFYYSETNDKHSNYYHRNMESNLDSMMLKRIKDKTVKDFKVQSIVAFDKKDIGVVYDFYSKPLKKIYGIDIDENIIDNCMHMFYSLQKHLYDKTGIKNAISEGFEKITKIKSQPLSMIVPKNYNDYHDLLNLNHDVWYHPVTKEASRKSFLDLFNEAINLAEMLLELLNDYIFGDLDKDEILKIIDNKTYDTGLNFKGEMQYFAYQENESKN